MRYSIFFRPQRTNAGSLERNCLKIRGVYPPESGDTICITIRGNNTVYIAICCNATVTSGKHQVTKIQTEGSTFVIASKRNQSKIKLTNGINNCMSMVNIKKNLFSSVE